MNEIKMGIGWKATGTLTRAFVVPSGKCAFVTLEVVVEDRSRKHEFRAFDGHLVSTLGSTPVGSIVTLTGVVDREALKDKAHHDVQADGRTVWTEKLTVKAIKVERAAQRQDTGGQQRGAMVPPDNDGIDNIPFVRCD